MTTELGEAADGLSSSRRRARKPAVRGLERGILAEWIVMAVLLLFASTTLIQAYVIPTSSMEPTLLTGDHLLVDKLAFAPPGRISGRLLPYLQIRRGDIIVFRYPSDISQTYVKRVIGIPGDRIRIVNRRVHLNGKPLVEPYVIHRGRFPDSFRDNYPGVPNARLEPGAIDMLKNHVRNGVILVPERRYFALGDNRDQSSDSRYWGFVPRENIMGKPVVIYWSYDGMQDYGSEPEFGAGQIFHRIGNLFRRTRWGRTAKTLRSYRLEQPD
jgi:signal peptidase I